MMMIMKRKEVLIGSLIMLILVAAFINYNYTTLPDNPESLVQASSEQTNIDEETSRKMGEAQYVNSTVTDVSDDYFAKARMDKQTSRSQALEMLREIASGETFDEQAKKKAQEDMIKIAEATDKEATCENLVIAKGFSDCVVFISEDTANVTVKSEKLSNGDTAKIQEIICSQTGISIKNIKIVEVK